MLVIDAGSGIPVGHPGLSPYSVGAPSLVQQTGDRQPAAIGLYESVGYRLIVPYAPFELMSDALWYEEVLIPA